MPADPRAGAPFNDAWAALEHALSGVVGASLSPAQQRELAGEFMAMGQSHDPERRRLLWAYKHVETRHYLFLDEAGRAYTYDAAGGRYTPLPVRDAVARARAAA